MRTIKVAELQSCSLVADAAASATPHFGMVKFSSGPVHRLFASRLALLALLLAGQIRPPTSHSLPHRLGSALTTWFCTHLACLSFAPALVSTLAWVLRFPWFRACLSSALASRSGSVFACLVYLLTHRLGFTPHLMPHLAHSLACRSSSALAIRRLLALVLHLPQFCAHPQVRFHSCLSCSLAGSLVVQVLTHAIPIPYSLTHHNLLITMARPDVTP